MDAEEEEEEDDGDELGLEEETGPSTCVAKALRAADKVVPGVKAGTDRLRMVTAVRACRMIEREREDKGRAESKTNSGEGTGQREGGDVDGVGGD